MREKEAVLQNVDPHMRAELEREFEEQSASTKRHTIGAMRLIGKFFVWKMITLTILCKGFIIRVLYVVTGYCFTWWTCEHAAHASAASQRKFIILELIISTATSRSRKSLEIFVQIFAVKDEALLTSRVDGLWLKFINV
ncbi:hypothetical protein T03_16069 [Trichinella britovi]|uniref:Uncharacterized protein n=1 Tax=Trichinella britovi TaxID=45882 RepID=A0A0V1C794_TRIBR|nr:hypothetical protein T03_16069 [Trichinella britovi]KRZ81802.1 hypothetical protein T08_9641 [Trichinella sp. T8]